MDELTPRQWALGFALALSGYAALIAFIALADLLGA